MLWQLSLLKLNMTVFVDADADADGQCAALAHKDSEMQ